MELTKYHKKEYGEKKEAPDAQRCAEEIYDNFGFGRFLQCSRKRGHGPDEAFCKQHDPEAVARRNKKVENVRLKRERTDVLLRAGDLYRALKKIADGYNDARTLASEELAAFDRRYPKPTDE